MIYFNDAKALKDIHFIFFTVGIDRLNSLLGVTYLFQNAAIAENLLAIQLTGQI